jgi:Response regulator containing CheY-like receiver, AAA-type ATPase, and DNA-binding domains
MKANEHMTKRMKNVVIVEDRKSQREIISATLAQYGFAPIYGATISEARELLYKHKDDAAVIILDINLFQFPDYKEQAAKEGAEITGIGLANRILKERAVQRPEIIILSGFPGHVNYLQQAINGGASVYLNKLAAADRKEFVPSVQALALKCSFQPSSFNDSEITKLAEGHANGFELLNSFCHNKLASELDLCLGRASYLLLFRNKRGDAEGLPLASKSFSLYSDVSGLPGGEDFDYLKLHQRIFDLVLVDTGYVPDADALPVDEAELLKKFIFIQLVNSSEVEIALGILNPFPVNDALGEYPFSSLALAKSLIKHASPVLETFVEKLMFRWREKQRVKLERVKTLADFSGSVQRRLKSLLPNQRPGTMEQATKAYDQLKHFAQELADGSSNLSKLLESSQAATRSGAGEITRLSDVVQEIKTEYDRLGYFDDLSLVVEADCLVPAERYYLSLALRELVKWSVNRSTEVTPGEKQLIQVRCTVQGNWTEIYLSERSKRLSKRMREGYLFEPMSPLHMAQMIVEVACHGKLIDVTDESKAVEGHLFKIRLLRT